MRNVFSSSIPTLLLLLMLFGLTGSASAPPSLKANIDQIINSEQAETAIWGIYILDLSTDRVLYQHNANKTLMPASNQKLLTTATALDALGSDYRYQTTLYFDGEVSGSVMKGDLILEGSGDPTFGSREVGGNPLRDWAQQLAEMGVTRIEGRIIGNDDIFDDEPYAPGWDVSFIGREKFAQAASGLSYRDNLAEVRITGAGAGQPPKVEASPDGYFTIRNHATTSGRRRGSYPVVTHPVGTETVIITGSTPQAYQGTAVLPVSDPTAFTLYSFEQALAEAGIEIGAEVVDIDDLDRKPEYEDARPLFVQPSPPMHEIITIINKESNNLYAEHVFRTFAWGGHSEGGENRVKAMLSKAGASAGGLSIRDGSGLSRKDMLTSESIGQLLSFMYRSADKEVYLASLPSGGEEETTLRYRLADVPVRAKTGSLEYARALSGYTSTPDGRPVAFSIIANNYTAPSYSITQAIDLIVQTITSTQTG